MREKCASWDGGALGAAFAGVLPPRKTARTECGRRRAASMIDDAHPTCPECVRTMRERREACEALAAKLGA